jgi:hypothetical protein
MHQHMLFLCFLQWDWFKNMALKILTLELI